METLKNQTILIGKDPKNGRLQIAMKLAGQYKSGFLGEVQSVPGSVSRCQPAEEIAHCKIEIDGAGVMKITNIKPQNVTWVNGVEIQSKVINPTSHIALSRDKYPLNLTQVLEASKKLVGTLPPPPQEFSIKPLEKVWDDYHKKELEIQYRQRNTGLLARLTMVPTLIGGLVTTLGGDAIRPYAVIFTVLSLAVMLYGFYKTKSDDSIAERERIKEDFERRYICPNPKCGRFKGYQSYRLMAQADTCPYCKCKYNEK
ncbi:MAG: hypothetical protein IJN55_06965 [Alistipes sp.]|nr:FHA domain-containing protein [Rikenellaceae bacterium]MBQ6882290.1 hypothetical protein [Alistipes sp.]MBR3846243.1 hypothetical protein [Alistipes sp.]MBR7168836.1 hypothetical protein [Alistipes sp.]